MDARQLNKVSEFAGFLELLTNPEEFKKLVSEAKEENSRMEQFLQSKSKVEEAEKYLESAKDTLDEAEEKYNSAKSTLENAQKEADSIIKEAKQKAFELESKAKQQLQDSDLILKSTKERDKLSQDTFNKANEVLEENNKAAKMLAEQEADLSQKASKLKELLG